MDHYWEERAKRSVERYEQAVRQAIPEMLKAFEQAKKEIVAEMYAFYGRYAKNNEITLAQAKQLLSHKELAEFKGNLSEYEKLARQSIGTFHLEVENISMKIRLNRLDALLMQVDAVLQELYQKQQKVIQETTERVTLEEYYHSQYDLSVSTGRVLKFSKVPESFIEQVLTSPVMGADISTRLWRQDIDSGFKIRQYLNQMFIEGKPPQYFAEELGKAIGAVQVGKDGKVIGSGKKYEAYRLLYNEASYAANQARLKAYREMGAPYYELTATLDIRTTPICQSLDGCIFGIYTGGDVLAEYRKTGSEYRQAAYSADRVIVGVNYPPFHVNCRTVAVPHYPTTDTARMTRAARDAEDNPITVPADMKYEEWYETYIEKSPKSGIIKPSKANQTLTDDEEWALNEYISSGSYKINAPLREGIELTQEQQELVRNLDSALEKMPVYTGTVYRSISSQDIDIQRFWAEHTVGSNIVYLPYTSSSTEIYDETMDIQMEIESKTARDLRSYNEQEQEILFPRECEFEIVKRKGNRLWLKEI